MPSLLRSESSGLGQYLSVLEGTGALAGRRDRQTDRQDGHRQGFKSVRDHSKEEEAAKCVVSEISQTTYLDPICTKIHRGNVVQESKASVSDARTSFFYFPLSSPKTPSGRNPLTYSFQHCTAPSGRRAK